VLCYLTQVAGSYTSMGGVPQMKVGLFTREYPPLVYGGAGVHVDYLSRELARSI
jgi:hypothetical protein